MLTGHIALTVAAIFTGAAVYINVAEQPARLQLDDHALLKQWKPAYKRGFAMQAMLAVVGFALATMAWWTTGRGLWLVGGLVLLANWPFTLLVILPVNNQLMHVAPEDAGAATRRLIVTWGWLHAGRSALGVISTLVLLWASGTS